MYYLGLLTVHHSALPDAVYCIAKYPMRSKFIFENSVYCGGDSYPLQDKREHVV